MKNKIFNPIYKSLIKIILIVIISFFFNASIPPDEGMFPLNELSKLDLQKAGLKINIKDIYNPNKVSLVNALVKVGGCTGSFVSEEGLILTNHHCAFDFVRQASSTENNYVDSGFIARNKEEEIPANGLTCLITDSYEDVSEKILSSIKDVEDVSERVNLIQKKIREIVNETEKNDSTIKAEVSEMFIGKTYILFKYKIIKDIRIVYVPPRSIGEFGGESDNWIWPRHNGDFSFLRAYVSKDGSAKEYSKDNIPFKPKKFLKVNPNGVSENDFIFILGYPGRTFRNYPYQYIQYQEIYQLPYIAELYRYLINSYDKLSENNVDTYLKLTSKSKGLANTEKNYRGKLLGLKRLQIVEKKKEEDEALNNFIQNNPEVKTQYGNLFNELNNVYQEIFDLGRTNLFYSQLINRSDLINLSHILLTYFEENEKPDNERKNLYQTKNKEQLKKRIDYYYESYVEEAEKITLKKILNDATKYDELKNISFVQNIRKSSEQKNDFKEEIDNFIDNLINNTVIKDKNQFYKLLETNKEEIYKLNDPLLNFTNEVGKSNELLNKKNDELNGELNILLAQYIDVKQMQLKRNFLPDANGTLRLTFGYIKGYVPADAVYYSPITSLKGVIEKSYKGGEYQITRKIVDAYNKKDFGRYVDKKLNDVPVAILYNSDTTGGNSGSPVMNAYGELIGLNFDRAYEATINDYFWSKDYSRSIGVDIRYILWNVDKIGNADYLLDELGIN
ncbi:MAG: S46 family peptidase [Ignavibacterium sp.]